MGLKEMIDGGFDLAEELIKAPGHIQGRMHSLAGKAFEEATSIKETALNNLETTLHARHEKPKKNKKAKNHNKPSRN